MPNGESKNWIRLLTTLESFYALHGRWPTIIHLCSSFIDQLEEKLSKKDFERLQSKIKLVPDEDNPFQAFDADGNEFNYTRDISPEGGPSANAFVWLNVYEPAYDD